MTTTTDTTEFSFSGLPVTLDHVLPALIDHVADRYGDTAFVVGEDGATTSFASFRDRARQLAAGLVAWGIEHGDRIAIWAPNSPEWMVAASAIESIGAILVHINTRFKGHEARSELAKTRARNLFTLRGFLGND